MSYTPNFTTYLGRLLIRIAHKVLDRLYFIVEQIDWFYNGSLME